MAPRAFLKPNFVRTFRDGDQHDIDDADGAQRQGDHADCPEEKIHRIKNFAHHLLALDGVPATKRFLIVVIEAVIAGDDAMHLVQRLGVLVARCRLQVDEGQRVSRGCGSQREIVPHGAPGHVDAQVVGVIFLTANVGENPDNFKADSVQQNAAADCRTAGKQVALHLVAQHHHVAAQVFVLLVEPAALGPGKKADLIVVGRAARNLAVAAGELADGANVAALKHGGNVAYLGGFAPNVEVILVR